MAGIMNSQPIRFLDKHVLTSVMNTAENVHRAAYISGLTVEIVEAIRKETSFKPVPSENKALALTSEQKRAIGLLETPCSICDNNGCAWVTLVGESTGIILEVTRPCDCIGFKLYHSRWNKVPLIYRDATYSQVFRPLHQMPSNMRRRLLHGGMDEEVRLILNTIDKFSDSGFLLTGEGGTGKTTLMCAMYQRDLANWVKTVKGMNSHVEAVWRVTANVLAEEFRNWAIRETDAERENRKNQNFGEPTQPPTITLGKVERAGKAGLRPVLYLEEVDKFKRSDFQLIKFHEILDAVYSSGGKVIASSNWHVDRLNNELGDQFAVAFLRRICGPPKGILIQMDRVRQKGFISINYPDDEALIPDKFPIKGISGEVDPAKMPDFNGRVLRAGDLQEEFVKVVETEVRSEAQGNTTHESINSQQLATSEPPNVTSANHRQAPRSGSILENTIKANRESKVVPGGYKIAPKWTGSQTNKS